VSQAGAALAVAAAAALALALTGCGSSPLSTGALRNRAARVCQLASARADGIPSPTLPVQAMTFLERGVDVLQPELNGLVKLRPGGQAAQPYASGLEAFRRELAMVKGTAESLRLGGDPLIGVKTLERQLEPIEAEGNSAWEALEIPACLVR
jgi:hypothetical protein